MNAGFFAARARLAQGWVRDLRLDVVDGRIASLQTDVAARPGDTRLGLLLPGVPNLHSHSFQRAIVGRTERAGADGDDFWSWRTQMYQTALRLTPEDVEALAFHTYVELLEGGYTSVCEFHYLHLDRDGRAYAQPAELALRIAAAAQRAGIRLCLLPVLYQHAGFGSQPPRAEQRRFVLSLDAYQALVEDLRAAAPDIAIGLAAHSLRAVDCSSLRALLAWRDAVDARMPLHIHIAEQTGEVQDCIAHTGLRPIALLAETMTLDARCCLVHATHASAEELQRIAAAGATVALCPTTEANLGDGVFPLRAAQAAGVAYGIGSDSQVSRSAASELRLLEYAQRFAERRRCVAARPGGSTGEALLDAVSTRQRAITGGLSAELRVGEAADFLSLPQDWLDQAGGDPATALDAWIFDESAAPAPDVYIGGELRVTAGRHAQHEAARSGYRRVLTALQAGA